MDNKHEYIGILRCRAWHTWPSTIAVKHENFRFSNGDIVISGRFVVLAYDQRISPEIYSEDETKKGPLLWDGKKKDVHALLDMIYAAPEDGVPIAFQLRNANRGEVDICLQLVLENPITPAVVEIVKAFVYCEMAMLNLQLEEHLVPTLPFQLMYILGDGRRSLKNTVQLKTIIRQDVQESDVERSLQDCVSLLSSKESGGRAVVAMELYAAHLSEKQARVRFLMLVMALEAIAIPVPRHDTALAFMDRWEIELTEKLVHTPLDSLEYDGLEALRHTLRHQRTDSIRSRVQNLFLDCGSSEEEVLLLRRRARDVYDKRSTLVHDGRLPGDELEGLEQNARALLELVLKHLVRKAQA